MCSCYLFQLSGLHSIQEKIDQKITAISPLQQIDDGWHFVSLKSSDIDSGKLQIIANKMYNSTYQKIHSVLIVGDGKLIFEQ